MLGLSLPNCERKSRNITILSHGDAFQTNLEVDIFAENILKKLRNLFLALYDEQYSPFCTEDAMYNVLLIEADELDRQYRLLFDNKYLFLKQLDAIGNK